MKVVMIGTGYVGLVSGTCFAEFGADVVCVDVDAQKVNRLRNGEIPIYEPGLEDMVAKNVREGRKSTRHNSFTDARHDFKIAPKSIMNPVCPNNPKH